MQGGGVEQVAGDVSGILQDEMAKLVGEISKTEDKIAKVEVEIAEAKLQLNKSDLPDRERSLQTFIFRMKLKEKDKLHSAQVGHQAERKLLREAMMENISNLRVAKDKQATSIDLLASIPCQ